MILAILKVGIDEVYSPFVISHALILLPLPCLIVAHYQRATIFMSLDRPQEALLELEKVRSAAPREASVHFNMGKVLKRLGQPEKAMRCFLTALDLDPKDNNLIKVSLICHNQIIF